MSDQVNPDSEKVAKAVVELSKAMDRQLKAGLSPEEGFLTAILFMRRVISETEGENVLEAALQAIASPASSKEASAA